MGSSNRIDEVRDRLGSIGDPLALLEGIFAHAPMALQIYGREGHSILTNDAFRRLFGSEPPPEYNVLEDEIARESGVLDLIQRAFGGETTSVPPIWYDPRRLRQVDVAEGNRVAIEATFFPLRGRDGAVAHVAVVFRDVTAEYAARAEAEAERDLLRLIIEQTGDGVIVADEACVIRIFNPEAERQHGAPRREIAAPEWARAFGLRRQDGGVLPPEETPLYRACRGEKVEGASWRVRRPDGSERVLSGTATPLCKPDGSAAGAVLVTRDETERLAAEEEKIALLAREQAARAEAEKANRSKDEFLAMLGHELRNPLAPIVTAIELLKLRSPSAPPRELAIMERQVHHLLRMVNDLLDVARIARGKVELRRTPVEIHAALDRALEMAGPLLEQQRHRLDVHVPREGLSVLGDPERLAQVFANLLTNAARYTPAGGRVEVRAGREGDEVVVTVEDDGVGIEKELLPGIFDLFVQGRRSFSRGEGGLGLGLALVKSFVEEHGGRVSAASAGRGAGSTFSVRLPIHAGASAAASRLAETGPARARARRRVLVVDDNEDAAELLVEALRRSGHEVEAAHDGARALALSASFAPEVGVLDLGLPVLDGYELAARLLAQTKGRIRLLAVSGYGLPEDRARTSAAGFSAHFVKPVDLESVLDALEGDGPSSGKG